MPPRVGDAIRAAEGAIDEAELRGAGFEERFTPASADLRDAIGQEHPPFWLPKRLSDRLAALGGPKRDAETRPGSIPVVVERNGEGYLLWLSVRDVTRGGPITPRPEAPPPGCLSKESFGALHRGAWVAACMYPFHWPLDPENDLEFHVTDLLGDRLELELPLVGESFGLACALATWSLRSETPVPTGWVVTGALGYDDRASETELATVSGFPGKGEEVKLAAARMLAPWRNRRDIDEVPRGVAVRTVGDAFDAVFGEDWADPERCPRPPRFDPLIAFVACDIDFRRQGVGRRWRDLAQAFGALADDPALTKDYRALAGGRAGICWMRVGDPDKAEERFSAAERLLAGLPDNELDAAVEVQIRVHRANVLRGLHRFDEACVEAERAVAVATDCRLVVRGLEARAELGQAYVALGRFDEGIDLLRETRDRYDRRRTQDCVRLHTALIEAYGHAGELADARRESEQGHAHNELFAEPKVASLNAAHLERALLAAELRIDRLSDLPADIWRERCRRAANALSGLGQVAPRPALERLRDVAQLRSDSEGAHQEVVELARSRREGRQDRPLAAWHDTLVLIEAATIHPDTADEAWLADLERWFPGRGSPPGSQDGAQAILSREYW